jgi:hypothetical protein
VLSVEPRGANQSSSNKRDDNTHGYYIGNKWYPMGQGPDAEWDFDEYEGYDNLTKNAKNNSSTSTKDRLLEKQRKNRGILEKLMENRKGTGSLLGNIVKSSVCTVAQYLANENNLLDTLNGNTSKEDVGTTKKEDVVVSSTDGKPIGQIEDKTNKEVITNSNEGLNDEFMPDLEASDTKYGAAYQEMDEGEIDVLESYSLILDKLEREAINDLPDDIKYVYLKNHYEKNVDIL